MEVSVSDRGTACRTRPARSSFSPFYTTKNEGMGMGPNICRSIVEFHEGRLWRRTPTPAEGCISASPCPWRTAPEIASTPPEQIIYLVDDDEALRDSLAWLLESQGFKVAAFASAEGLSCRLAPRVQRLPGARRAHAGHERAGAPRAPAGSDSTLPIIFITGHGDVPMAVAALKKARWISIREALQRHRTAAPRQPAPGV